MARRGENIYKLKDGRYKTVLRLTDHLSYSVSPSNFGIFISAVTDMQIIIKL